MAFDGLRSFLTNLSACALLGMGLCFWHKAEVGESLDFVGFLYKIAVRLL